MQCKSLWIKASAKCINVNVNVIWASSKQNSVVFLLNDSSFNRSIGIEQIGTMNDSIDSLIVSPLSCVCHVFPPLVSIFGLFPVLVKCHYELILVQPCLSYYLWFTCVFIVLSVQFDFVWSTHYSPVFPVYVSLALSCPALMSSLKTIIWVYVLVCVSLFLPAVCTVTEDQT